MLHEHLTKMAGQIVQHREGNSVEFALLEKCSCLKHFVKMMMGILNLKEDILFVVC